MIKITELTNMARTKQFFEFSNGEFFTLRSELERDPDEPGVFLKLCGESTHNAVVVYDSYLGEEGTLLTLDRDTLVTLVDIDMQLRVY